jgi:hypothetical protein
MGLAKDELAGALDGQGCLGKASPDEPVFILRAQDFLSDKRVDDWANEAEEHGYSIAKLSEVRDLAAQMRKWPNRKYPD